MSLRLSQLHGQCMLWEDGSSAECTVPSRDIVRCVCELQHYRKYVQGRDCSCHGNSAEGVDARITNSQHAAVDDKARGMGQASEAVSPEALACIPSLRCEVPHHSCHNTADLKVDELYASSAETGAVLTCNHVSPAPEVITDCLA